MGITPQVTSAQDAARTVTTGIRHGAWTLLVVLLFWALSASIAVIFSERATFSQRIFSPSAHEVADLVLVVVLACCFVVYYRRVSRQRAALESALEDALRKAESEREKVLGIIEAMGEAISIQDPQLNVLYQNRAHQELHGRHLGERCYRAYRNDDDVCPDCHLIEAFSDGKTRRVEKCFKGEGGARWFEIIGSVLKDSAGRITAGIELVREITDRKCAEQAAQKETALLQHLIDTIPNPLYYQDTSGRFVWCNTAFAAWLGKPRELVVGRSLAEVGFGQICSGLEKKAPGPEQVTVHEVALTRGDGALRDVILYKSVFAGVAGDGGGLVGVVVDITERKRAEEEIVGLNAALTQQALELQQANRELEAFSHAISHDLRTPLTKVYASGQALQECSGTLDEDGRFFVQSINDGCTQIEALLDALLVLSRVTEVDLDAKEVDLSEMAQERAAQLLQADPQRRVSFLIAPRLLVQGDRNLLQIALDNLIGNAWKYTSAIGEPVIEVGSFLSVEGELVFFVKDNGAGFDPEHAGQLFKPFRRLHSNQEFPGTGLGLATVRRIIRRHGGRVWGEGKVAAGATFYFTIGP